MVTRAAVELRVIAAARTVIEQRARIEDSGVECKAVWPGFETARDGPRRRLTNAERPKAMAGAARQLAGLVNAAQGEPVLLIIGLDEDGHRLTGARDVDTDEWLPIIANNFDEVAPELRVDVRTAYEDQVLAGLLFETDRAPYVFKADGDRLEVPFRRGTATRSARRQDLLGMLAEPAARRRGVDETRRLLQMALIELHRGNQVSSELAATIVNATSFHHPDVFPADLVPALSKEVLQPTRMQGARGPMANVRLPVKTDMIVLAIRHATTALGDGRPTGDEAASDTNEP